MFTLKMLPTAEKADCTDVTGKRMSSLPWNTVKSKYKDFLKYLMAPVSGCVSFQKALEALKKREDQAREEDKARREEKMKRKADKAKAAAATAGDADAAAAGGNGETGKEEDETNEKDATNVQTGPASTEPAKPENEKSAATTQEAAAAAEQQQAEQKEGEAEAEGRKEPTGESTTEESKEPAASAAAVEEGAPEAQNQESKKAAPAAKANAKKKGRASSGSGSKVKSKKDGAEKPAAGTDDLRDTVSFKYAEISEAPSPRPTSALGLGQGGAGAMLDEKFKREKNAQAAAKQKLTKRQKRILDHLLQSVTEPVEQLPSDQVQQHVLNMALDLGLQFIVQPGTVCFLAGHKNPEVLDMCVIGLAPTFFFCESGATAPPTLPAHSQILYFIFIGTGCGFAPQQGS